jgi:hypothetical protein
VVGEGGREGDGEEEEEEDGGGRRANALVVWFELVMSPEDGGKGGGEGAGEGAGEGGLSWSPGRDGGGGRWKQLVYYLSPSHPHTRNLKTGDSVVIAGAYGQDRLRVQVVGREGGGEG